MSFFQRPKTLAEVASHILDGGDAGREIKDFLHEFQAGGSPGMLQQTPTALADLVENGAMLDAYLQALAVYLSAKLDSDPPPWTRPHSVTGALVCITGRRNPEITSYSAARYPFRSRNLFIDEDSLIVA